MSFAEYFLLSPSNMELIRLALVSFNVGLGVLVAVGFGVGVFVLVGFGEGVGVGVDVGSGVGSGGYFTL